MSQVNQCDYIVEAIIELEKSMDYYTVLGLERTATQQEIKSAYRKLASKYHPDVNDAANATAFFQLINEAYQTLYDLDKRKGYDSDVGGVKQETPPPTEQPKPNNQANPQKSDFKFVRVNVTTVKKTGMFILLIPLKVLATLLLLLVMFLHSVTTILAAIATLVGGLILLLGVICGIISFITSGISLNILYSLLIAFIGFLVSLVSEYLPTIFEYLAVAIKKFIKFVPVKYVIHP
jgi:cation transport ATPase